MLHVKPFQMTNCMPNHALTYAVPTMILIDYDVAYPREVVAERDRRNHTDA
jgi:hypothetical protein